MGDAGAPPTYLRGGSSNPNKVTRKNSSQAPAITQPTAVMGLKAMPPSTVIPSGRAARGRERKGPRA